jgi:hypothetical protein
LSRFRWPTPTATKAGFAEALRTAELLAKAQARLIVLADEMSKERLAVAGRVDEARDGMSTAQWEAAAQILTRVTQACRELGLDAVFHHHAATYIENAARDRTLV